MKNQIWDFSKLILSKVNPQIYVRNRFKAQLNYAPNFKNPVTFNEKLAQRRFNFSREMTKLSDKIAVRDYVSKVIGSDYLIPKYFEIETLTEDVYQQLPEKFVIKANHGSGLNLIVKDKKNYPFKELKSKTDEWLRTKYHLIGLELHYKDINPKLIVEELLLDDNGKVPRDYKFHCFKNKMFLGVFLDRFKDKRVAFFEESGNPIEYPFLHNKVVNSYDVKLPDNFSEMKNLAKLLSEPFNYVRIDLYSINEKIYFGEFTFSPGGGIKKFKSHELDVEWGKFWD